jgi:hypothetical protein
LSDSWYDTAQICTRGHVITSYLVSQPQGSQKFCKTCGSPTITTCQVCNENIRGEYHVPGVISFFPYSVPDFCHGCGSAYPWTVAKSRATKELSDKIYPDEPSHVHGLRRTQMQADDASGDELSKLMGEENIWRKVTPPRSSSTEEPDFPTADEVEPQNVSTEPEDSPNFVNSGPHGMHNRVEIRKVGLEPDGLRLLIDGSMIEASVQKFDTLNGPIVLISGHTQEAAQSLLKCTFLEFSKLHVITVNAPCLVEWHEALGQVQIESGNDCSLELVFTRISKWRRPYTFADYFEELRSQVEHENIEFSIDQRETFARFDDTVFSIRFIIDNSTVLSNEVDRCLNTFKTVHESVVEQLELRESEASVIFRFDSFPDQVRVPCEQYLLYFGQFLSDLGVQTTTNIRHEAGNLLFAVTPTDEETALDNIRIALGEYLKLARSPIDERSIMSVAEQRLAANVDHLRSQLRLANATIETQQTTIDLFRLESARNVTPAKREERITLFRGTVTLGKLDKYGVQVDLSEVFRNLRRLFTRDP